MDRLRDEVRSGSEKMNPLGDWIRREGEQLKRNQTLDLL